MSLEEPSLYKDNFNKLYKMFNTSLVEIRDIYIQFRLGNSNNSEYEKDLNILNNIRADIFTEQQELFKGNEILKIEIETLNYYITKLNSENNKLSKEINNFNESGLAAEGELDIQKTIYKQLFTQNLVLFFSVLLLLFNIIGKFNKNK